MTRPFSLQFRLLVVREVLTGDARERGLQAWFARQIKRLTGWQPSNATVHRWIKGVRPIHPVAASALVLLEQDARSELLRKLQVVEHGGKERPNDGRTDGQ